MATLPPICCGITKYYFLAISTKTNKSTIANVGVNLKLNLIVFGSEYTGKSPLSGLSSSIFEFCLLQEMLRNAPADHLIKLMLHLLLFLFTIGTKFK